MKRGCCLTLLAFCAAVMLAVNPFQSAFGQEGTITPLSMGGEKITLLHQSSPVSVKQFISQTSGAFPTGLSGFAADNGIERMLSIYSGDLVPGMAHRELLADISAAGHDVAGLSRDALLFGQAALADALTSYADFPHLASNLTVDDGPLSALMRGFTQSTLDALRANQHSGGIYDGVLIDANGVNVCLFGLIDPLAASGAGPVPADISVSDPVAAAERLVGLCEAAEADLIVSVLTLNTPHRLDNQIKDTVAGIDVFILGGADSPLDPDKDMPISVARTEKGSSVSVQDEGLGRLDLTLTANPLTLLYEYNSRFLNLNGGGATAPAQSGPGMGLILLGVALAGMALVAGWLMLRGN